MPRSQSHALTVWIMTLFFAGVYLSQHARGTSRAGAAEITTAEQQAARRHVPRLTRMQPAYLSTEKTWIQVEPNQMHWQIRKSDDRGRTWEIVDEFRVAAPYTHAQAKWIAEDVDAGALYVVGEIRGPGVSHALVRRSQDGGATWETLEDAALLEKLAAGSSLI